MIARTLVTVILTIVTAAAANAGPPEPVTIQTQIVFVPLGEGTFTASAPLCAGGTMRTLREVATASGFNWIARAEFTCYDNSGTFTIQVHVQAQADPTFTVSGPWSIWSGTGNYAKLSGRGNFGAIVDFSQDPLTAEESYIGFLQLH